MKREKEAKTEAVEEEEEAKPIQNPPPVKVPAIGGAE